MERLNDLELSTWRYFLKSHNKVIEQIERDLTENKRSSLTTYDVLIVLYEAPDQRVIIKDLTERMVLTKSGITRLLDRLEKDGLIKREKSEEDRRSSFAVITELGIKELKNSWPTYAKGIKQYFASFMSEEELKVLNGVFRTISDS